MRLPMIPPASLSAEQRPLYDDMRSGISSNFNAFKTMREDGALMGPWNPWLHEPAIGRAIWQLPEPLYRRAVAVLGQAGTNELIYLVGVYALVSMTLNGFGVPVPDNAEQRTA